MRRRSLPTAATARPPRHSRAQRAGFRPNDDLGPGERLMAGGVDTPIQPLPDAAQAGPIGKRRWAIAEGFIPPGSTGEGPEFESHETVCILNANDAPAVVRITLFFEDRDPIGPYGLEVPARRTVHARFNSFENPPIPKGLGFASIIESDLPIVCQHTRLDSRQAELALLSTVAFSEG